MAYEVYNLSALKLKLEDRWDGSPFWDDTEAKDALNEALLVWNSLTGQWKARTDILTVQNQKEYTLPSSLVFGFRVEYNGRPLTSTSLVEMDNGRPGWDDDIGTPRNWIPIDLTTIQLWPAPAVGNVTLTVDGVAATPQLDADDTYIQLSSDLVGTILNYALHALTLKEGGERFMSSMTYFEDFLKHAAEINTQLMKSEMFRQFLMRDAKHEEHPTK